MLGVTAGITLGGLVGGIIAIPIAAFIGVGSVRGVVIPDAPTGGGPRAGSPGGLSGSQAREASMEAAAPDGRVAGFPRRIAIIGRVTPARHPPSGGCTHRCRAATRAPCPDPEVALDGLAEELGIDPEALQVTVERLHQRRIVIAPFVEPGRAGGAQLTEVGPPLADRPRGR